MEKYMHVLEKCILFRRLKRDNIQALLNFLKYEMESFSRDALVAQEGDHCERIGIVLQGEVELQNIYPSGKVATLTTMGPGNIFGEAILFSNRDTYPINIVSRTKATILFLKKEQIVHGLTHHPVLLENFLSLLSNRLMMMSQKVKVLSLDTIRHKLCNFLLKEMKEQGSKTIQLNLSRKAMAEHMSVQRPSLSRELIKMKEEGLIDYEKKTITILDVEGIEDALF